MILQFASLELLNDRVVLEVGKQPFLLLPVIVEAEALHAAFLIVASVAVAVAELSSAEAMEVARLIVADVEHLVCVHKHSNASGSISDPCALVAAPVSMKEDSVTLILAIHDVAFIMVEEEVLWLDVDFSEVFVFNDFFSDF